jgi:Tfp pilus assembly protein PilW
MKNPLILQPAPPGARRARRTRAFTVAEMMVAVFIFVFMVLGIIYVWMFCLKYDEVVCSKLGASEKSRMGFDELTGDIRAAKWWKVGSATSFNGTSVPFTACGNATNQFGNAVKLSASGDTNSSAYVIYYFDTNNVNTNACWLCRWSNGLPTVQILAQNLTNSGLIVNGASNTSMTFQAQQYSGSNALDWQYKYMIVTTMEFCQYQYPLTRVGPGYYYNYYRIQLKAASHCPN